MIRAQDLTNCREIADQLKLWLRQNVKLAASDGFGENDEMANATVFKATIDGRSYEITVMDDE